MAIKKNETAAASMDDVTDEQENLPATRVEGGSELGVCEGDLTPGDLRLPRLQLVYGVGRLSKDYNPGSLILGDDNLLVEKGKPLRVIILHAMWYWKEYLSGATYQPGKMPRSYRTVDEVKANGGTTAWEGSTGPTFNRALQMRLLIQQPEGVLCSLFGGFDIAGKAYAPAVWDVDKSAYRRVGPVVLAAAQFSLRQRGLISGLFEIVTKSEQIKDNLTVVPTMKLVGHNSDDAIAQIKALFDLKAEPEAF